MASDVTSSASASSRRRVRIRMYRQGLGDCFLLTFDPDGTPTHVLIDCGVILGTPDAASGMRKVAEDIAETTGGRLDILIATHEHWDHLSGFLQAKAAFQALDVGAVWMGWTEDPADPVARGLVRTRNQALAGLRLGMTRLQMAGDSETAGEIEGLLGFFGASGATTADALEVVRGLHRRPTYVRPEDPPREIAAGVKAYVLGPPTDLKLLRKSTPSAGQSYGFDAVDVFASDMAPALLGREPDAPFDANRIIPRTIAETLPFFREHYLGPDDAWRSLEGAWLSNLSDVALKLDSDTNNTSVVVAFELDGGDVLLFTADAQIGSWLSWPALSWKTGPGEVTGADLLTRTVVYKVGHHGSHNATLKPGGLETMKRLTYALLPVDAAMARKKRWGRMPLPEIVGELERRTEGRVIRIDADTPPAADKVTKDDLYFDLCL